MPSDTILYNVDDHVATITLNRPDRLNALVRPMEDALFEAMREADASNDVRVIVLTGAGRGFCAGADLEALDAVTSLDWDQTPADELLAQITPPRVLPESREDFQKTWSYFAAIRKPVIAAVNGPAVGLGFILPLFCDLRFASETARFGTAFAQRGLIAEYGISWMLPRLVGLSNALDLLYSARIIGADEALRMGLVSRVFPAETLLDETLAYARTLATTVSPRSLRVMKRQVYDALLQPLGEAIEAANHEVLASLQCDDFKEGVAHFLEQRPPEFTGR